MLKVGLWRCVGGGVQEHEQSQAHAFFALNNGLGKLLGYGLGSISLVR